MPLVFDGVVRYSVIGNLFGEDCVNILDVDISTGFGETREDACSDVAGDILNNWTDHILPRLSAGYEAREVRWVDLNSLDGSTGSRSSTDVETWPMTGSVAENTLPNNVYVKVVKAVQAKTRTERNGTLRLGGIPESATVGSNGNTLNTTYLTGISDAFEDFKDGINGGTDNEVNLCVLHTVDGVATAKSTISRFNPASTVGTLRRRMPGYGS